MTERCATCKWWDRNPDERMSTTGVWAGDASAQYTAYRTCKLTVLNGGLPPEHGESLAIAEPGEECWASLQTAPDFGCVQWEPIDRDAPSQEV